MQLEHQVVSLELAKKLKELGVKQDAYCQWFRFSDRPDGSEHWVFDDGCRMGSGITKDAERYSAFTVTEIGNMLPRRICEPDQKLSGETGKCYLLREIFLSDDYANENITTGYQLQYGDSKAKVQSGHALNSAGIYYIGNEADARAKMLIYLLENKLINL